MQRGLKRKELQVMSFRTAVNRLGWRIREYSDSFELKCDCGEGSIVYSGGYSCEEIYCSCCGKRMSNLAAVSDGSNNTWVISGVEKKRSYTRKRVSQLA